MANYADARWTVFQNALNELMNMPEFKHKPSPALVKFLANTDMLVPASQKEKVLGVKQSDQDTVAINLIKKQSISPGSARAAAHTGSKNDSQVANLTFTTYSATFKYGLKSADRVIWDLAVMVAKQLRSAAIALNGAIETALLACLNTNKSQVVVSATPKSGEWDAVNSIFKVLNSDYEVFMQRIKGFMREQYYRGGEFDAIFDEKLYQKAEFVANQGTGNYSNLGWQLNNLRFDVSEELTIDEGYMGMGYLWPVGILGVIPWIPRMNREGFGDTYKVGGLYTNIPDPLGSGLTFAVHERAAAADNNGTDGELQDIDVEVELSVDLAPVIAPMSTASLSPIFKFGVLES